MATALTLAASLAAVSTPAHAGGFLGDLIRQSTLPGGEIPGCGDCGYEVQSPEGTLICGEFAGGCRLKIPSPILWSESEKGNFPAPPPQQQSQMGNFCYTQAGRFGPGSDNSLGAPCLANTPYGPMQGQIGH